MMIQQIDGSLPTFQIFPVLFILAGSLSKRRARGVKGEIPLLVVVFYFNYNGLGTYQIGLIGV
jgi:hypothetical protein